MGEGAARRVGYRVNSSDMQRSMQLKGTSFSCLYRFKKIILSISLRSWMNEIGSHRG